MYLFAAALLLAPTMASPILLEERGSCPKTNVIASALKASSSASSFCSQYLSIGTQTKTFTSTPACSTTTIKTTCTDGTVTSTCTAPAKSTTAVVTATLLVHKISALYTLLTRFRTDTTTVITNTVTSVVSTITVSSTTQGTTTITSVCNPRSARRRFVERAVNTPPALQSLGASCLTSACSCLSLHSATTTV